MSLADFKGRKLVLYFYPKADTPGCTLEAKDFSRLPRPSAEPAPQSSGFRPIRCPSQDKFRAKHDLSVPLASDESHEMLTAYGVWGEKSMYGRKLHGHHAQHVSDRP